MNRRSFMATALAVPIASLPTLNRTIEQGYSIDEDVKATIMVGAFGNEREAEKLRRGYVTYPWGDLHAEFYEHDRQSIELPESLSTIDGALNLWQTTVGVAAQKGEIMVGAFRRHHIAYIIRFNADERETVIRIAEAFAGAQLPDAVAVLWSEHSLRALLPDPELLGDRVELAPAWWQ